MGMKEWNRMFGYGFFSVGASKIIIIILTLIQLLSGKDANIAVISIIATIIGFVQIIIFIGSIVMIILNKKEQPEIITGYLLGIGVTLIEIIIPKFLSIFYLFTECGLYMRAGAKIINANEGINSKTNKDKKQIKKDIEWFYGNK